MKKFLILVFLCSCSAPSNLDSDSIIETEPVNFVNYDCPCPDWVIKEMQETGEPFDSYEEELTVLEETWPSFDPIKQISSSPQDFQEQFRYWKDEELYVTDVDILALQETFTNWETLKAQAKQIKVDVETYFLSPLTVLLKTNPEEHRYVHVDMGVMEVLLEYDDDDRLVRSITRNNDPTFTDKEVLVVEELSYSEDSTEFTQVRRYGVFMERDQLSLTRLAYRYSSSIPSQCYLDEQAFFQAEVCDQATPS